MGHIEPKHMIYLRNYIFQKGLQECLRESWRFFSGTCEKTFMHQNGAIDEGKLNLEIVEDIFKV